MRALTLLQPWAHVVAHFGKNVENRPPGFSHKSFRGEFLIHAGVSDKVDYQLGALEAIRRIDPSILVPDLTALKYGGVIGIAKVVDLIPPGHSGRKWHFPDSYGFVLEDIRALPFIPCRGYQGFWRVPHHVAVQVNIALGRAA